MILNVHSTEYVKGSHLWNKENAEVLDTTAFHAPTSTLFSPSTNSRQDHYHSNMLQAAQAEGISPEKLQSLIYKVKLKAGGCSFHNGRIWHGSNF